MLLKSIELKNFRQFIDEKVDFSTDKEKNVTIIMGDNGAGKTTFAQAFFWCFYGETSFTDKNVLNNTVQKNLMPDQKATVKVAIRLRHGSADYEIIRTQDYKKGYSGNSITAANTVLNVSIKLEDGNTRFFKPLECETEIKKILPKELSTYFFFDGERIEKMSKEITGGKKSSGFADAVVGLTGLKATLTALSHLSPTKTTSVIGKFDQEYTLGSDSKIQKLTQQINELKERISAIDNRLIEIDDDIATATAEKSKAEEDIKQYADGEKLQNERDKLNSSLQSAKKMRAQFVKTLSKSFNDDSVQFFSLSLAKRALSALSESDFNGKDIPEMHSKTIEYLLNRKICICGTHLDEGTIPYTKVKELFDYLPPQSIGVTVSQFKKESKQRFSKSVSLYSDMAESLALISEKDDEINATNEEISLISEKLDGDDIKDQVKKLNAKINTSASIIDSRTSEQKKLLVEKGGLQTQLSQLENSRAELSLLDDNNRNILIYKAYARKIYEEMYEEYTEKEISVRKTLETYINEIFKTVFNGGLSLEIDEKYNIKVSVNDYIGSVETSTAQSISVIFAFITAIIKMAKENQETNADVAYSEPYPLVMDAPLSAFDKRRIEAICTAIPNVAEQVIIFIKDTDGELAEKHIGTKIAKRHVFEIVDEFNTNIN